MLSMRYLNEKESYLVSFNTVNKNIVQITGDFPVKTSGFILSREGKNWKGDYSDYTTVYREVEGGIQFSNDGSVYVEPEPIPEPEPYVPTLDEVQKEKISEMSAAKQAIIDAGIDVTLSSGVVEHFTMTEEDQRYLTGLQIGVIAGKETLSWYTADESEHCKFYSPEDITLITDAALTFVNWHVSYFKDLRIYIRSLDNKEAVKAVTYGIEIPEEYRSEPLQAMMAAQNV